MRTHRRTTSFVLTTCALIALGGCARGTKQPDLADPARRRDLLLHPDAPFWSERAPDVFRVRVETSKGAFVIESRREWAPRGVDRFYGLVQAGFFDDSRFYRVVPGFIAQFGLPGDPAITRHWTSRAFPDDSVRASNVRGTLAFATTGPNTRMTQIYINLVDNQRLDAQGFSPIGRVVEGMAVVDSIYGGYGENAGGGVRAGKQGRILTEGNAHLDRDYPRLDKLLKASIER